MKIDAMSGYLPIRKAGAPASAKQPVSQPAAKTDVVDFSRGLAAPPDTDKSILALRSSILHDAAKPADAKKLAALKESVRAGAYRPSSEAIADAVLGRAE